MGEEAARLEQADEGEDGVERFGPDRALRLDSGATLPTFEIAYRTYGRLNADRSNAVLITHALTGDQHVASPHPITHKPGWWTQMVGPGKPIDTDRYFVICSNVLGGCMGTTGPSSLNPFTAEPWGLAFPVISIADMVRAQAMLLDALGIDTLFAVIGGSMGGMQVLQWAADYPERVFSAVCIASAARHSAQNIAFHEVGRQAIMADPDWQGGDYACKGGRPEKGLAVARMAAHITYLSEAALQRKFGRELQRDGLSWGFDADFQVESYLRHQGRTFVDRFDANSYLYITRAMDYFDLASAHGGVLAEAFRAAKDTRFCVLSFTSDWMYPTVEGRAIVRALNAAGARASFVEIASDKCHDAFLLDEPVLWAAVRGFLESAGQARGVA
jgi:homoserine O-acetyltransferase/O-succinyltransferase